MGALIRSFDWARTPLGPIGHWPQSLKTAIDVCLGSAFASYVWWGPELVQLYNDPALRIVRAKHPAALGAPACGTWADVWEAVGSLVEHVIGTGEPVLGEDLPMVPDRGGARETATFTFSYSALRDEAGAIAGLFVTAIETTEWVRAEAALRASQERLAGALTTARMAAWDWDPVADRTVGSDTMAEVFGLRPGESLDSSTYGFRLVHPEDRERHQALVQRAGQEGAGWHSEFRILRPRDGQVAWLEERATVIRDPATGQQRITGLVWDITERKQAEAALRDHQARLAAERERLAVAEAVAAERQALLKRIVRAQEEERAKVSREIHDSVTQLSHAAAIHLDLAVDLLDGAPPRARQEVERGRDLARQAANEARRLIAGLRPETLDTRGLSGALQQEVEALRQAGWRVDLEDGDPAVLRLDPEAEITLFRVAQEALSNVRKHAGHARVRVRLKRQNGTVHLEVRDWGRGFDPQAVRPTAQGEHVGLTSMRERLYLLGGKLEVRSGPDHGTTIRASLPVRGSGAARS
jgi:PAS domain S-box-containing protein